MSMSFTCALCEAVIKTDGRDPSGWGKPKGSLNLMCPSCLRLHDHCDPAEPLSAVRAYHVLRDWTMPGPLDPDDYIAAAYYHRIRHLLRSIGRALGNDVDLSREDHSYDSGEHTWSLRVEAPNKGPLELTFEILRGVMYDGPLGSVNFSLSFDAYLGACGKEKEAHRNFTPDNYTESCWAQGDDAKTVRRKFEAVQRYAFGMPATIQECLAD